MLRVPMGRQDPGVPYGGSRTLGGVPRRGRTLGSILAVGRGSPKCLVSVPYGHDQPKQGLGKGVGVSLCPPDPDVGSHRRRTERRWWRRNRRRKRSCQARRRKLSKWGARAPLGGSMAPLGVAWCHWGLWGGFMAPLELWGGCMAPLGWWGGYMAPSGSACPPWRGCGKDGGSRWGPPPRQHPHPSTENGEKSGAEGAEGGPEPGAPEKRRKSVPRERKEPPAEGAFEFWTELEVQRVKFLVREGAKEGLGPPLPEHWDPPPHVQASHWDPHPWAGGSTMGPPSMGAYPWWVLRGGPGAGPPPPPLSMSLSLPLRCRTTCPGTSTTCGSWRSSSPSPSTSSCSSTRSGSLQDRGGMGRGGGTLNPWGGYGMGWGQPRPLCP